VLAAPTYFPLLYDSTLLKQSGVLLEPFYSHRAENIVKCNITYSMFEVKQRDDLLLLSSVFYSR